MMMPGEKKKKKRSAKAREAAIVDEEAAPLAPVAPVAGGLQMAPASTYVPVPQPLAPSVQYPAYPAYQAYTGPTYPTTYQPVTYQQPAYTVASTQ